MERWRKGLHYFSIPGGGIEQDETALEAAVREIAEETSITVTVNREVLQMHHGDVKHHIFLCVYVTGEPNMQADAPEILENASDNRFKPGWFAIDQLETMPFVYWQPIKKPLIAALANGFSEDITIVNSALTA
jgi:8-oxo-dGTP pyrophosphatase MutT (NUDIX family)